MEGERPREPDEDACIITIKGAIWVNTVLLRIAGMLALHVRMLSEVAIGWTKRLRVLRVVRAPFLHVHQKNIFSLPFSPLDIARLLYLYFALFPGGYSCFENSTHSNDLFLQRSS